MRPNSLSKLLLPASAAVAFALAAPGSAGAAVSCSAEVDGTIDVTLSAGGDVTTIKRQGPKIDISGCGPFDAASGRSLEIVDTSAGGSTRVVLDLTGGPLGPGQPLEASGQSEVEVEADLKNGSNDLIEVVGTGAPDVLAGGMTDFGALGLNLNGDDDRDVLATGVEQLLVDLGGGHDEARFNGPAGQGFVGPTPTTNYVMAGPGHDLVRGGSGVDAVVGGTGDDDIATASGSDGVLPGAGDDVVSLGGDQVDRIHFMEAPAGVRYDLAVQGPQNTNEGTDTITGADWARGSEHADVLLGSAGANTLIGAGGDDRLVPRGGDDVVEGSKGHDTVDLSGAPGPVTVTGFAGTTGADGTDVLTEVEGVVGSAFADVLEGTAGADTIDGGAGADVLRGLGGADRLLSRDGGQDVVACGEGADEAVADHAGLDALDGCESIDRPEAPKPPVVTPPTEPGTVPAPPVQVDRPVLTPAPVRFTLRAKPRQRLGRRIALTGGCVDQACTLAVTAKVAIKAKRGRAARTLTLPATRKAFAAGRTGAIALPVSAATKRRIAVALRRGGRATVTLTVSATGAAGLPAKRTATVRIVR